MTAFENEGDFKTDIQDFLVTSKTTANSILRDDHVALLDRLAETLGIASLTEGAPLAEDYLPFYDTSADRLKKVLLSNLIDDVADIVTATNNAALDTLAIQAAVDALAADVPGVIILRGTFTLTKSIFIPTNKRPIFRGGKITKIDESKAILTTEATAGSGDISFDVDTVQSHWDTDTFLVLRDPAIATVDDIGPNSHTNLGLTEGNTQALRINDITGNTITVSGGLNTTFAIGKEVVQVIDMFRVSGVAEFHGMYFDGNLSNNPVESWLTQLCIAGNPNFEASNSLRVYNCIFVNNGGETIFATDGSSIVDCIWHNCNGSGVHLTTTAGDYENGNGINIVRPYMVDCCLKAKSLIHAEGYITFSNRSKFTTVRDGIFLNTTRFTGTDVGSCTVLGDISVPDNDEFLTFENNFCLNFEHITKFENGHTSIGEHENMYSYRYLNNTFVSCGDIYSASTANITQSAGQLADVEIANNRFWGARLHLRSMLDVKITGNKFYLQGYTSGYFANALATDATAAECIIHVYGDLVDISDNQIHPHVDSATGRPLICSQIDATQIIMGIRVESEQVPVGGTQYLEMNEVRVTNNRINGMEDGIHVGQNTELSPSSDYHKNVLVANNTVIHDNNGGLNGAAGTGIAVKPGCVCRDNLIIGITQMVRGITLMGGATSNPVFDDRWLYCLNNVVRLAVAPTSSSIGAPVAGNSEAICVVNNITSTGVVMTGTATNRVNSGNITTTTEPDMAVDWQFHVFDAPTL